MSDVQLTEDDKRVVELYRSAQLQNISIASVTPPPADNPIILTVIRDERDHLGEFLSHYRRLGAELFAIVDNGSIDGSREYLAAQPDVDLYRVDAPFEWHAKQAWLNRLIDHYGIDRWYVCADADEHMAYDGNETRSLREFVARIQSMGLRRVRGFLLDMYSDLPLALAAGEGTNLRHAYPYFDRIGYREERLPHIVSRTGGPRRRAFGTRDAPFEAQLTKYPLFRLRPGELFANPHHIWPCDANFRSPCLIAMLHYKFHGGWLQKVLRALRESNYWEGSREYRAYATTLEAEPGLSLYSSISSRLSNSSDLVDVGLIQPIDWSADGSELPLIDEMEIAKRCRRSHQLSMWGTDSAFSSIRQPAVETK